MSQKRNNPVSQSLISLQIWVKVTHLDLLYQLSLPFFLYKSRTMFSFILSLFKETSQDCPVYVSGGKKRRSSSKAGNLWHITINHTV